MAPAPKSSSKKRPASSQAGPASKKAHIDKPSASRTKPEKVAKDKKRSQPVTKPLNEDNGSDSEWEDEIEEVPMEQDEFDVEAEQQEEQTDPDAMQVDGAPRSGPPKDPNAARESHKAQRAVQDQRRAAKPHSSLLVDAKRVWSLARQKNIPAPERQKHVQELMEVIRGRVKDIVFKHDASRIVQTVVKHGGQKERDEVAVELQGKFKELAQNKYSKFLVTKLIRLCPTHRPSILLEFQGNVMKLVLHRDASSVIADAFELWANAYERTILLRDFYGKENALFSTTTGSDVDKERAKKGLPGILEGLEGERRKRVLSSLKDNLVNIFNNPDKGAVTHAIVHRALWEYLTAINDSTEEGEADRLRREIFEVCQDALAEIVHTRDGSRVVREFIAHGTAKDRKHIIKVLKPHVQRMCIDDEAQLVLFTAFDIIDDTKLTAKSLLTDITSHASTIYTSPQGRRSLFYLLVPRTRRHFTPAQIVNLAETDAVRARTSKKDVQARSDEIRKAGSEALLSWIEETGNEVARETGGSLVVTEVMLFSEGDKSGATNTILTALNAEYPSSDDSTPHPIDLPHTSRMYKTLLQGGHFDHTAKSVVPAESWSPSTFASAFIEVVGKERTVDMAKGNGAFVVAELLERIKAEGSDEEKKALKGWFGKSVLAEIEASEAKGKKVLAEKVAVL